jgi:SAC3 family protein LENG8/THP3
LAYKILYYLFCDMETDILRMLKHITPEEKLSEPVKHALAVRSALAQGNYGRFFKLFRTAPNLGNYLMDIFIDKHRILSLIRLTKAYVATNVEMKYLKHLLAFDSESQIEEFLTKLGCKIADGKLIC